MVSHPWQNAAQPPAVAHNSNPPKRNNKFWSSLALGASIVTVGAVAFGSYWIVRDLILDRLKENASLKVQKAEQEIDTWLAGRLGEVTTLANSPASRSQDWAIAEPYLQLEQDRLSDFWMFIWVKPDGSYYTTRNGFATGKNLSDRAYFQTAMQGQATVSDMIISRTTGKRQINIAAPIWSFSPANYQQLPTDRLESRSRALAAYNFPTDPNQKPTIVGILSGNIAVSHVTNVVNRTQEGKGSYAFALDSQGVPIAHPNPALLNGINSLLNAPNPELARIAQAMVKQQQNVELMQLDGQWVYVAYAPLQQASWSVALVIPRANVEQHLNALNVLATMVGGMVLIATLIALRQIRLFEQTRDRAEQEALLNQQLQETGTQLQDALAYLTAIIDNLADGLLVIDRKGLVSRYNPALCQLFGLCATEMQHQDSRQFFSQELLDLIDQANHQPDQVLTAEIRLSGDRLGKAVITQVHPSIADPSKLPTATDTTASETIATVILIRDITAEKEVDQMKTDFISTVSHELRTPLTSVLGFAKLIKKRLDEVIFPAVPQDEKKMQRAVRQVEDNIDIIVAEGLRLTALINDVLDIAKMEAGKVEWKMEPLGIEEIVDRALAATDALFQAKQLEVLSVIEPNLPRILGDRDRLIQVVINLLSNAVKFTDQGSVTCEVTRQGDGIIVRIIDTGSGIAPEDQPFVFEKFKQVGNTLTDKPKGTGLGLPICKQIVEHHGGTIWVESAVGQGSTFAFTLPISVNTPTHVREMDLKTLVQQLKAQVQMQPIEARSQKSILVVDDEAPIRQLLRQQFEAEGYQVIEAEDGRRAVQQVKAHRPDLIILDLMMPDMNGFDTAAVLKNDPETMGIPLVILSILADEERAKRLGDRCLTKPINAELLLQEVESLISQGTSHRKVLVVDENEHTVKTLVEVLKTKGFTVVEAINDAELLEKTATTQPDMVIANAQFWHHSTAVQALKLEKGLENILLLLIADTHHAASES
ncbi:ATP-binding protein [Alkalinema pantanalense CENA528]|uniref:ATP-binding protein n=1 Tax=Alkalinema pantanalense TaxID=1620705 RepID=UPI003D6E7F9A